MALVGPPARARYPHRTPTGVGDRQQSWPAVHPNRHHADPTRPRSVCARHTIYADVSAQQYHELRYALHHQWRTATRAVMVVLSAGGMPACDIGALLHYSLATVRRRIARHQVEGVSGLPDRHRSGRPRIGLPRIGDRIAALLSTPKAWITARVWQSLDRPAISLRTCYRRIREQARWATPRLVAKGDLDLTACLPVPARCMRLPHVSVLGSTVLALAQGCRTVHCGHG